MQELNMFEVNEVSGGFWMAVLEGIAGSVAYDLLKGGAEYVMANSHMGRGHFPPVPRAGHE